MPTLDADHYESGDVIASKYRLVRRIGEGAAGQVWEAINTAIGLPVAIKLSSAERPGARIKARLRREAEISAMLTHPAIVRVFDYGESFRGEPYLVMELLRGETLGSLLARVHHLPAEVAVRLLLPVASGVAAANLRGIVHRDLKPDNIVITRDDAGHERPKVVDFGVAMTRWLEHDGEFGTTTVVGTPEYMAPEQALALDAIDRRADVWGFCILLYEALSGVTPFGRTDYIEALCAVVDATVSSLVDAVGLDVDLWQILAKGLNKDPLERWSDMNELGRALAGWLLGRGVTEDASGASLVAHWMPQDPTAADELIRRSSAPADDDVGHDASFLLVRRIAPRDDELDPCGTAAAFAADTPPPPSLNFTSLAT